MSLLSETKGKIAGWLVTIPNTVSIGLGLLLNLALLSYTLSSWPGNHLAPFLMVIILYVNLIVLYLQANIRRIRSLETERNRSTQVLEKAIESERAHFTEALDTAMEAERSRSAEALTRAIESERAHFTEALDAAMEAERSRSAEALTRAMEAERAHFTEALDAAMEAERSRSAEALTRAIESERAHFTEALDAAIAAERSRSAEALDAAMEAERSRSTEALAKAMEAERTHLTEALDATMEAERTHIFESIASEKAERLKSLSQRDTKWFQSFSRVLTLEDERLFCTEWSEILGVPIKANHVRYLQHRLNQVEDMCLGRLAGSVQDAILRILVASSLKSDTLQLLEIGTLFGINAIATYDILSLFFEQVKLTLIDPLDGYYGSNKVDIATALPVTRPLLQRNLASLNIPAKNYTIIQDYSNAPTAVKQAGQQSYNFIFVDGDHSYEGIKADFELYSPMLERGGYLVFDDYHRDAWPEVGQFVDEVVLNSLSFECVGTSWNTVVFRSKQ
jgi:chemotaxis protein histidine kinase CheA